MDKSEGIFVKISGKLYKIATNGLNAIKRIVSGDGITVTEQMAGVFSVSLDQPTAEAVSKAGLIKTDGEGDKFLADNGEYTNAPIESVTGKAVDNTDPRNPVIGGIEEAPIDGEYYARKDGLWANIDPNNGDTAAFIPDFVNRSQVMAGDGTWAVTADGFVQRAATVTHPSTAYAGFSMAINGITAWSVEYAGLLPSGLYDFTSPPIAVKKGDVVVTTSNGNGITSTLFHIPPQSILPPIIGDAPIDGKQYARKDAGWSEVTNAFQATTTTVSGNNLISQLQLGSDWSNPNILNTSSLTLTKIKISDSLYMNTVAGSIDLSSIPNAQSFNASDSSYIGGVTGSVLDNILQAMSVRPQLAGNMVRVTDSGNQLAPRSIMVKDGKLYLQMTAGISLTGAGSIYSFIINCSFFTD